MLYICPTPIGNLEDITLRTLDVLKSVDLIACEDTRVTRKLLNHYNINAKLSSYYEHNKASKGEKLCKLLFEGKNIALVSDAGMPGISDPGEDLVKLCIEMGIPYTVLPGANAALTALVASGLPTRRFVFEGFLPKVAKERKERLSALLNEDRTIIMYESPHHLIKTLEELKILGDRRLTIIREISKKYEEIIYSSIFSAKEKWENKEPRGEYVLIIDGISEDDKQDIIRNKYIDISITEHLKIYEEQGLKRNEAMKSVAKDLGITKREVYKRVLEEEEDGSGKS